MAKNLYTVVEHFKDAAEVYERLWDRGRLTPKGLKFVKAWVDENVNKAIG